VRLDDRQQPAPGTTASISARNFARRVTLRFSAQSVDPSVVCFIVSALVSAVVSTHRRSDQRGFAEFP